jgi:hypothetical protein
MPGLLRTLLDNFYLFYFNLAARRTYTNNNFIEHYHDAGFGSLADV